MPIITPDRFGRDPRFKHVICGSPVEATSRTVQTTPQDPQWPKDLYCELPFCPACKTLVPFTDLESYGR